MKFSFLLILLLSTSVLLSAQKQILVAGSGWDKILLIDKKKQSVKWSHSLKKGEECNSVACNKKGEILYAYKKGVKLITKKGETVWDFKAQEGEIHSASLLPNDGYLIAISGSPNARIIELDQYGRIQKEIEFETEIPRLHGQFRQVRKSKAGTYLVPLMARSTVIEIDANGKLLKTFPVEGNVFAVLELDNGNLLVSCGDAHCFVELDRNSGQIVRKVGQNDLEGVSLQFVAEIAPFKDNLFICNWAGHSEVKDQPAIIELDAEGNVVWTSSNPETFKNISAIFPKK
ncbi:MAG: hypothetical protein LIO65_01525 [Odoribacter sp.]|nr:hypothetical protein [Odoribacter sp.]